MKEVFECRIFWTKTTSLHRTPVENSVIFRRMSVYDAWILTFFSSGLFWCVRHYVFSNRRRSLVVSTQHPNDTLQITLDAKPNGYLASKKPNSNYVNHLERILSCSEQHKHRDNINKQSRTAASAYAHTTAAWLLIRVKIWKCCC